jgi:hypothetical protein
MIGVEWNQTIFESFNSYEEITLTSVFVTEETQSSCF